MYSGVKGSFLTFDLLEAWIRADGGKCTGTTLRHEDVLMVGEGKVHTLTIRELSFIGEVSNTEANLINLENLS